MTLRIAETMADNANALCSLHPASAEIIAICGFSTTAMESGPGVFPARFHVWQMPIFIDDDVS
jgi:hypothetical protein